MRPLLIATVALFTSRVLFGQAIPSESERLVAAGKLWVTVKYFHPALASINIDWDAALIKALPAIRGAQTQAEYSASIQAVLSALPPQKDAAAQRLWVHHGLAPAAGPNPGNFHSAFYAGNGIESIAIPMGGFDVTVALSEPISAASALVPVPPSDRDYADTPYPSTELRILALYKIWGVIHYFFAYRDLMDEDWDELLPTFLPKFIAAKDAREYNLTIADLLTHAADSQTHAHSAALTDYFGAAPVGLRLRLVEKQAVITAVLDPEATTAGIQVGDIVKSVDGETLVERFKRESPYVSASTIPALGFTVVERILNGPESSIAKLAIEDSKGTRKEIGLKRSLAYNAALATQRTGDAVRILPGNIGYADLDRLAPQEVDPIFEKFRSVAAIIFDARSTNAAAAREIAPRLSTSDSAAASIITGPLTLTPDLPRPGIATKSASYFFVETLADSKAWKYKGKTVLLVDERTAGAAEHSGLLFEAANSTEVVGSPSAGADTDLSNFTVPGGVTISFSGHDIRHANGGKLQRLGHQPNVSASPTIGGIRAGKDEVLEKAIDHLSPRSQHPPAQALRSFSPPQTASKLLESTSTVCYFEQAGKPL